MSNPGDMARNLARMAADETRKAQEASKELRKLDALQHSHMATHIYESATTMLDQMNVKLEA
jgi:hypothetical protein